MLVGLCLYIYYTETLRRTYYTAKKRNTMTISAEIKYHNSLSKATKYLVLFVCFLPQFVQLHKYDLSESL